MNNKKGVELSMNLIIIAVMALIVLVIVILLVTGTLGNANKGISTCSQQKGGGFALSCSAGCSAGKIRYPLGDTKDNGVDNCCCIDNPIG